ncbi:MAG TPA: hypothetical protein VJB95_00750 [Candidatus Paceibacterota bacterium]
MKRGQLIYKILDFIENRTIGAEDFVTSFLKAGYGASFSGMEYQRNLLSNKRIAHKNNRDQKRQMQIYVSKLKSDGLISKNASKISLTPKGKTKLEVLKTKNLTNKDSYNKETGKNMIIVSYDLPVAFNRERNILRDILRMLGFRLIHKSVWIGKVKLPKQFIEALNKMDILKFVEILEVTKNGSLKEII